MITPAPLLSHRQRFVAQHMNTVISLAGDVSEDMAARFFESVALDESRFSRFLPTSDLSQLARGQRQISEVSADLAHLLALCDNLRTMTDGDFEFEPQRRSGRPTDPILDPNALAKGWIVGRAARSTQALGARNLVVNAGGDVLVSGLDDHEPACRVGIRHPANADAVAAILEIRGGAVATSGRYERGNHIRMGEPSTLASATVTGPDLGVADALSTAVFASGAVRTPPPWWDRFDPRYGLILIDDDSRMFATHAASALIAP